MLPGFLLLFSSSIEYKKLTTTSKVNTVKINKSIDTLNPADNKDTTDIPITEIYELYLPSSKGGKKRRTNKKKKRSKRRTNKKRKRSKKRNKRKTKKRY